SGFLIFLVVVGGGILAFVLFVRSKNKKRVAAEISVRRETVQNELAEIGADIVELSDRVTVADQADSTNHYRLGNEQYLELQTQLGAAKSLWEVTQVDYAADTAAWHLDAAEALLDGEPLPDEPERPDLAVSRPPEEREVERERNRASERGRVDSRLDDRDSRDRSSRDRGGRRVEPRQRRRDDWDAPKTKGGGFGDIITGILVGGALNGGGIGRRRAPRRYNGGGSLGGFGSISRGGGSGSISRGGSGSISRGGSGSRGR
ncbi:MAG: hypothetical protein GXP35_07365, partial [Actinobacteria bacterium]|nr:hypothetical protein [Actinomycetota bacterium]